MQLIHIDITLSLRVLNELIFLDKSGEHIFVLGVCVDLAGGAGRLAVRGGVALDFGREDLGRGGLLLREEGPALVVLAVRAQLPVRRRLPQHRLLVQRQVLVRVHDHGRSSHLRCGFLGRGRLGRLSSLLRFLLRHHLFHLGHLLCLFLCLAQFRSFRFRDRLLFLCLFLL